MLINDGAGTRQLAAYTWAVNSADPVVKITAYAAAAAVAAALVPNPCAWERTLCRPQAPDQAHTPDRDPSGPPTAQNSVWLLGTNTGSGSAAPAPAMPFSNSMTFVQPQAIPHWPQSWVSGPPLPLVASLNAKA